MYLNLTRRARHLVLRAEHTYYPQATKYVSWWNWCLSSYIGANKMLLISSRLALSLIFVRVCMRSVKRKRSEDWEVQENASLISLYWEEKSCALRAFQSLLYYFIQLCLFLFLHKALFQSSTFCIFHVLPLTEMNCYELLLYYTISNRATSYT